MKYTPPWFLIVLVISLSVFLWIVTREEEQLMLPTFMPLEHLTAHESFHECEHPLHCALAEAFPVMLLSSPTEKDLYEGIPLSIIPVDDQGQWGSCTAHALRYAWSLMKYYNTVGYSLAQAPSRAFWYATSRQYLGLPVARDTGSSNYASVWALANKGSIRESLYPYTTQNILRAPPQGTLSTAASSRFILRPPRGPFQFSLTPSATRDAMIAALNANLSLVVGFVVYSSFVTNSVLKSGIVPMPNTRTERVQGGHAICITGFNMTTRRFSFRNSWGPRYGKNGVFTIPFDYITNPRLTFDAFVI